MKKNSMLKPTGNDWLGKIPTQWGSSKIIYYAKLKTGGTPDKNKPEYWENGTINWMSSGEVNKKVIYEIDNKITDLGFENSNATLLPINSIMIALNGQGKTKGKVAILQLETTCNQSLAAFICDEEHLHYKYLYYFLESKYKELRGLVGDELREGLTLGLLKTLYIPLPSFSEQRIIADFLDCDTEKIDDIISKKQKLLDLLNEERAAIINQAVTKGIDPDVEMKDSGIEWLGKIPKHWQLVPFKKYLLSVVDYRGKTPTKREDGTIFLVTARNIKGGIINYSLSQEYISNDEYNQVMQRGKPIKGDVLFTTEAPLGEVANVDREDIALAQRIIKFRANPKLLDNYYLKEWLSSNIFQNDLQSYATGSTALGIKASKLNFLKLLLPPLEEQKKILTFICKEKTKIDFSITKIQKEIDLLQEYRTALISEVVTGKIDVREEVASWT